MTGHTAGLTAHDFVIPATVTCEGTTYSVTSIKDHALYNCTGLTGSLTIPNSVTSIGENAFASTFFTQVIANPDFTTIDKGVGYIYHIENSTTLEFNGKINAGDIERSLTTGAAHGFNSPADSESRFTVRLGVSNGNDDNGQFVYQYGKELVIDGKGTLQVFDVLGRVVISEEIHGQSVDVSKLTTGAYIVRMTGNEVKTQKIIVR
ncbi:MAG: leucine-rich repeat domain-containing protein [Bacteroidales bacterium]|nr:leucine-rich repeat domain-containing protein [Bacteroidales bacterium]